MATKRKNRSNLTRIEEVCLSALKATRSLSAQGEPTWVGGCSKFTEVIQTDASFVISFEMEDASVSATSLHCLNAVSDVRRG